MNSFKVLPESVTDDDILKFSAMFQDGIMQQLSEFSEDLQRQIHYLACLIMTTQFKKKSDLLKLNLQVETVKEFAFSAYLENGTLTNEHVSATKACAKHFLARINTMPPRMIISEQAHLDFFSREDYIAQWDYRDELEERLAKLEGKQDESGNNEALEARLNEISTALNDAILKLQSLYLKQDALIN